MPTTVKTVVYEIGELDERARDKARAWHRNTMGDDEWHLETFEEFNDICAMLGVTLNKREETGRDGRRTEEVRVYFTGFSCQGDGASFEGVYKHAKGAPEAVRGFAPSDTKLHEIADTLEEAQKRCGYELSVEIEQNGSYVHEYTMSMTATRDNEAETEPSTETTEAVTEALRELARWLYKELRSRYEALTEDEAIDETIAANEWKFTKNGKWFEYG